jgi:hypothetical protein
VKASDEDLIEALSRVWLEGLRNPTKISGRMARVPVEIRTGHLSNTSVERYSYTSLTGR